MWPKLLIMAAVAIAGTAGDRTTETPATAVPQPVEPIIALRMQHPHRVAQVSQRHNVIIIR